MTYPLEIKNRALALYLKDPNYTAIYKQLGNEFPTQSIPKIITVRKWVDSGMLEEYQKTLHTDVLVQTRTREIEKAVVRQEEQKKTYRQLVDKAGNKLFGKKALEFVNAMDATRALDIGIQGERKITTEQLNLQFVEDVFSAIYNVIRDEDALRDISIELRKVLAKHNEGTF